MKKIICILLLLSMFFGIGTSAVRAQTISSDGFKSQVKIIKNFFKCIDSSDWDSWALSFAPSLRDKWTAFVNEPDYVDNNVGILALDSVEVLDVNTSSCSYVRFYPELAPFCEDDNYRCYEVLIDAKTHRDNAYYSSGKSKHLVILVKEDGNWYVALTKPLFDESGLTDYEKPSAITVKYKNGEIATVDFNDFVFRATCNELGNMEFNPRAVEACALTVKMIAWWSCVVKPYASEGCDLSHGQIAVVQRNYAGSAGRAEVRFALGAVSTYCVLSDEKHGSSIFPMLVTIGDYSATSADMATGSISLYGSSYLGDNAFSMQDILHFYFDYCDNNGSRSIGEIQFVSICSEHDYGSSFYYNEYGCWQRCKHCDFSIAVNYTRPTNRSDTRSNRYSFYLVPIVAYCDTRLRISELDYYRLISTPSLLRR